MYSFGVLLWELFKLGEEPWADVEDAGGDLLDTLKRGGRLPIPTVPTKNTGKGVEITLATDGM